MAQGRIASASGSALGCSSYQRQSKCPDDRIKKYHVGLLSSEKHNAITRGQDNQAWCLTKKLAAFLLPGCYRISRHKTVHQQQCMLMVSFHSSGGVLDL